MTVQTYATAANVQHLLSDLGVTFRIDDYQTGTPGANTTEANAVTNCIEHAATKMNMIFANFTLYSLASLASNEWCKWCNAVKAAVALCKRRGNPVPMSLLEDEQYYEGYLKLLQNGVVAVIPGTVPTIDGRPALTNFTTEPFRPGMPVRRQDHISTGTTPDGTTKNWPSYPIYNYEI